VVRRRLDLDDGPKYMYYKGFPRRESLFASWLVSKKHTDHVVITEGSLDAVAVWQAGFPAVAQYGSSITEQQVILLRRLGITKVTLFFDNDKAGREATMTAVSLMRDFLVYIVQYQDGDGKDPGAMKPSSIKARIDGAKRII